MSLQEFRPFELVSAAVFPCIIISLSMLRHPSRFVNGSTEALGVTCKRARKSRLDLSFIKGIVTIAKTTTLRLYFATMCMHRKASNKILLPSSPSYLIVLRQMHVARGSSTFSRIVCRLRYSYRKNRYVALNSIRPLSVAAMMRKCLVRL
jgi:hypothetical protein